MVKYTRSQKRGGGVMVSRCLSAAVVACVLAVAHTQAPDPACTAQAGNAVCVAYTDNTCFPSVENAISSTKSNSVVIVRSTTVNTAVTVQGKSLTVTGCPGVVVKCGASNPPMAFLVQMSPPDGVSSQKSNTLATFSQFTVQDCPVGGLLLEATNITIDQMVFKNIGSQSDRTLGVGVALTPGVQATVRNSTFENIVCPRKEARGAGLFAVSDSETASISVTGSKFLNNSCGLGGGMASKIFTSVDNCVFIGNSASKGPGSALMSEKDANITNCLFQANIGAKDSNSLGSAIVNGLGYVANTIFRDNIGDQPGLSLYGFEGTHIVKNCTFINNTGLTQGGAYGANSATVMTDTSFIDNVANNGEIPVIAGYMDLTIENCLFKNNTNLKTGGTAGTADGVLTIRNSTFIDNTCTRAGAAINQVNGDCLIYDSTFTNNTATEAFNGGAVQAVNSNVTIVNSTFRACSTPGQGGAVHSPNNIVIKDSFFYDNNAEIGGAVVSAEGYINITNSVFFNNTAKSKGGAIASIKGLVQCTKCNMSENTVTDGPQDGGVGGGIYAQTSANLVTSHLICNRAGVGGGLYVDGVKYRMDNVADSLSNNAAARCPDVAAGNELLCIAEGAVDSCQCEWSRPIAAEKCGKNGRCASDPKTGEIGCTCNTGYYFNGTACLACAVCGSNPTVQECSATTDTVCDCPKGKTGNNCAQICQPPPNAASADTSVPCQFDQSDYSKGVPATKCNKGYFLTAEKTCEGCSTCGSDGEQVSGCNATHDTVCRCPAGTTGDKCALDCTPPPGCDGVQLSTLKMCVFDKYKTSIGVICFSCRDDYWLNNVTQQCQAATVCQANVSYEISAPSTNSDRVCKPLTVCKAGQFESVPPTKTTDRGCQACSNPDWCKAGTVKSQCTNTSDIVCDACVDGRQGMGCSYQGVSVSTNDNCQTYTPEMGQALAKQFAVALKVLETDVIYTKHSCGSTVVDMGMREDAVTALSANGGSGLPSNVVSVAVANGPTVNMNQSDSSLSTGAIVGIVIGAVAVVSVILIGGFVMYTKRAKKQQKKKQNIDWLINEIQKKYKWMDANTEEAAAKLSMVGHQVGWLPRSQFTILEVLGKGAFGQVSRGVVFVDGAAVVCAVKQLLPGDGTRDFNKAADDFLREAEILKELHHPNIVSMIGVSMDEAGEADTTNGSVYMLLEYCDKGDLKSYLNGCARRNEHVSLGMRLWFCMEIAKGLEYLASIPLVHRDIAARNVLLRSPVRNEEFPVVKISDMGLARLTIQEENYVKQSEGGILPVRWMAPETLQANGIYTEASDVWSYAVCVWEIFANGAVPYEFCDNTKFLAIQRHAVMRLNKPAICPDDVYDIMGMCWEMQPDKRPRFHELAAKTSAIFGRECPQVAGQMHGYASLTADSSDHNYENDRFVASTPRAGKTIDDAPKATGYSALVESQPYEDISHRGNGKQQKEIPEPMGYAEIHDRAADEGRSEEPHGYVELVGRNSQQVPSRSDLELASSMSIEMDALHNNTKMGRHSSLAPLIRSDDDAHGSM